MKNRFISYTVGLIAAAIVTSAWGFDIRRAKTEAEILVSPRSDTPFIQLNFKAQLFNDGISDITSADFVATWEQVGGVDPVPYKILIPAGCFVRNRGFHVDDFRTCGVEMTFPARAGLLSLPIMDFEASVIPRRNGTARLRIETSFRGRDQSQAILGSLGGSAVGIVIGAEMGTSLLRRIESVSGVSPTPF